MKVKCFTLLFLVTHFFCAAQDLISEGSNRWIFHTPDDGRTTMYIAPFTNNTWQWGKQTQFLDNGNVIFSGSIGIGTSTPSGLLGLVKSNPTNENDIIASFLRERGPTGGSSIVRFGYHNTGDLEINSGYTSTGHRFGSYFDLNIVNNHLGGDHGGVNLVTNNSVKVAVRPNGNVGIGTNNPSGKLEVSGRSAVYSDFASYSGTTINNILPNGKEPTLIVNESPSGNLQSAVGGQVTYRGGLSFGKGGPGIYSINPNPAGSGYYGELRFHTTYWNGSDYNNSDRMVIKLDGNVGIGTTAPDAKLTVAGNINSREVKVTVDAGADFVFEKDYALPSLQEVEKFVTENKHLPEIASAKEMQKEGINLSEMNIKLLQKIEELTLYLIEQNEKIELQQKVNDSQSKEMKVLKNEVESIKLLLNNNK